MHDGWVSHRAKGYCWILAVRLDSMHIQYVCMYLQVQCRKSWDIRIHSLASSWGYRVDTSVASTVPATTVTTIALHNSNNKQKISDVPSPL